MGKLQITEQFLWLIYEFFEKTGKVLDSLGFGLVSLKGITPLDREFWWALERKKRKRQFAQFINYLKKQGYIQIDSLKERHGILLTSKGQRKALIVKYKLGPKFTKRKDKKWIMIIFDIPEKIRKYRDEFRNFLISLRFQKLQKSVWICPYDVLKNLEEIIQIYSLDRFIRVFFIEEIEIQNLPKNEFPY
jgi:CRISPR-associated endonuclease Cas2